MKVKDRDLKTVSTKYGRVITYSSFEEMTLGQIARGKTGIKDDDMRLDVQCMGIMFDDLMASNGFKYLRSGVGKADHGLVAFYEHSDKVFKVMALGAPKWEPKAKPYLAIDFEDEKLSLNSQFFASLTIDEDTDLDLLTAFIEDVVIEIQTALSGKECNSLNNYSGRLRKSQVLKYA